MVDNTRKLYAERNLFTAIASPPSVAFAMMQAPSTKIAIKKIWRKRSSESLRRMR